MADEFDVEGFDAGRVAELSTLLDRLAPRIHDLERNAHAFASTVTRGFSSAVVGGKRFEDVLKSLALRMSDLALRLAFKPIERSLTGGLTQLVAGLLGGLGTGNGSGLAAAAGAIKPFAAGGVIGTPTYFPLLPGGIGLAGEAGPEAILPLARAPDGRLGVAAGGNAAPVNVTIHIATPDAESFRRSEVYLTGQIARAVARGQRGL